jgi:hypothetical protein
MSIRIGSWIWQEGGDGVKKMAETASAAENPDIQADSVWYGIPPVSNYGR